MQIEGIRETVIIPFFHAEDSKIRTLQRSLAERRNLREFLTTPQFSYLGSLNFVLTVSMKEITNLDKKGKLGSLIVTLEVSGGPLNEKQVPEIVRRFVEWVGLLLFKNRVTHWAPYTYSVLTISKTDYWNVKKDLETDKKLLASLVFMAVPVDLHFTDEAIGKVSEKISYLETDFYCFSPYGSLVYDRNLPRSQKYIDTHVISTIADLRTMQAFLETLSKSLNEQINRGRLFRTSNAALQEIADLREASLKALASIEYERRRTHLADVSQILTRIFGLQTLQTSIEHKVDALNSITQALEDLRYQKIQRRLNWTNLLLAIVTSLLGLLALLLF